MLPHAAVPRCGLIQWRSDFMTGRPPGIDEMLVGLGRGRRRAPQVPRRAHALHPRLALRLGRGIDRVERFATGRPEL